MGCGEHPPRSQTSLDWRQSTLPALQVFGDLVAVETPVLDKNLVGAIAGHNHARQVDSRHIALQALRIEDRLAVAAFDAHAKRRQEIKIRMIAGHRKNI